MATIFWRQSPTPVAQEGNISGRTRLLHFPDAHTRFLPEVGDNNFDQLKQDAAYAICTVVLKKAARHRARKAGRLRT